MRGVIAIAALLFIHLVAGAEPAQTEPSASQPARELEEGWAVEEPSVADVAYADDDDSQRLDVYFAESKGPSPAVIFIHGGGWSSGTKARLPLVLLKEGRPLGIAVVSVDYRLTPVAPWPAQIDDVQRAIQFVRARAAQWNIDPGRLGAMGTSAGAHLALMAGARDDIADRESDDPPSRQSSRVQCVVSFSGPADFHLMHEKANSSLLLRNLLWLPPDTAKSEISDAQIDSLSPVAFVTPDDPPMLLCQGLEDRTVSPEHAKRMDARLREAKVESKLVLVDGAGHNLPYFTRPNEAALGFIRKHLVDAN